MMSAVHEDEIHRGQGRYTLTETKHGHAWGACEAVDGFFGKPRRGTYELFGWVPEGIEARGWVGHRVWLVPGDEELGPWLLEDAESAGRLPGPGADSLVLTGLDDHEGPPEGYRGPVRVHDGHRWLGSCGEFGRVLPPEPERESAPRLLLRGLTPSDRLRAALAKGTRRALDLGQAALEVRDDRGEPLAVGLLRTSVSAWRPSSDGRTGPTALVVTEPVVTELAERIDLELDGQFLTPVPEFARPLWDRRLAGPPDAPGAWAGLDTRRRGAWLDLVQGRLGNRARGDRPAGHAYELDGRYITDVPGLYLALGEPVNGPGGYFGSNLDALVDCLRGTFGYTAPATLLWRDSAAAREHLTRAMTPYGSPRDLFAEVLDVLAGGGMRVTLA